MDRELILATAENLCRTNDGWAATDEQIAVYDFAIRAMVTRMAAEPLPSSALNIDTPYILTIPNAQKVGTRELPINETHIIAYPWKKQSLVDAIVDVSSNGYIPGKSVVGHYYEELNAIIIVNDGNHHGFVANFYPQGRIKADAYTLASSFSTVSIDEYSKKWHCNYGEETALDERLLIVFELAKRKCYIQNKSPDEYYWR